MQGLRRIWAARRFGGWMSIGAAAVGVPSGGIGRRGAGEGGVESCVFGFMGEEIGSAES